MRISLLQRNLRSLFHGFASQLFFSIVSHHSVSFASFFQIWPLLQSKIFEHLFCFQKFGGISIFIPFQCLQGAPRACRGNIPRWAEEVHKLMNSMAPRDPAWLSFGVCSPQGFFAQFSMKTALPISQPHCVKTFLVSYSSLASACTGYFPSKKQEKPHKSSFFFFCQNLHVVV